MKILCPILLPLTLTYVTTSAYLALTHLSSVPHSYVRNFANTYIFCCCIPLFSNLYLYIFLDNHDVNRVASMLKVKEILKNVYILLFCMPGIPSVYYGSEWVIEGERRGGLAGYAAE